MCLKILPLYSQYSTCTMYISHSSPFCLRYNHSFNTGSILRSYVTLALLEPSTQLSMYRVFVRGQRSWLYSRYWRVGDIVYFTPSFSDMFSHCRSQISTPSKRNSSSHCRRDLDLRGAREMGDGGREKREGGRLRKRELEKERVGREGGERGRKRENRGSWRKRWGCSIMSGLISPQAEGGDKETACHDWSCPSGMSLNLVVWIISVSHFRLRTLWRPFFCSCS